VKPSMEEPSNHFPLSKQSSSSLGEIVTLFSRPDISENIKSMNSILSVFTFFIISSFSITFPFLPHTVTELLNNLSLRLKTFFYTNKQSLTQVKSNEIELSFINVIYSNR